MMPHKIHGLSNMINDALDQALKRRGVANIIIAGKTGVGKSTLINAVFQGKMADTGQGKPVTQHTKRITKQDIPVAIYDTKGLEVKDYNSILEELMIFIEKENESEDPSKHIHVSWLCIAEGARRVEDAEIQLAEELSKHMPVIIVITTAISDQGFKSKVKDLFPFAKNVVRVNSLEQIFDDGNKIPPTGLEDLINITMEVIPEGQKKAFAAAQRIQLDAKVSQAHKVVAGFAISAGGVGAIPMPFSDAIGIIPIQIGMIAGITAAFGMRIDNGFLATLVASTFTTVTATVSGRALVAAFLKFFPGLNTVGSIVSAATATAITTAFGEAYIATLCALLVDNPDRDLSASEIADAFKGKLKSSLVK